MNKNHISLKILALFLAVVLCINPIASETAFARIAPVVLLSDYEKELDIGEDYYLYAYSSDGRDPKFSSSNNKIASVDSYGKVTAKKAGKCTITAKAFTTEATCEINVKKTTIKLNKLYARLYRCQSVQLTATVSSGISPVWKSNKKSVAIVNEDGKVTALKHGTALITAKAGDISKVCEIVVESPEIKLDTYELTLNEGQTETIGMTISSGNAPKWTSSKKSVATVDQLGNVYAKKAGTTVITVSEDGTKQKCIVHVIENTL